MLPEVFKLLHLQVGRAKKTQELLDLQESAYVRTILEAEERALLKKAEDPDYDPFYRREQWDLINWVRK